MDWFGRRYRLPLALAAVMATGLIIADAAAAGQISDELQQSLRGRNGQERIAVIIRFADRIDLERFRNPERRTRSIELLKALQEKAARSQGPVTAFLQSGGAQDLRQLWLNNSLAAKVPVALMGKLAGFSEIESIRTDAVVPAPTTTESIALAPEWNIDAVHAGDLWALGFTGAGTVVANMDTGVDGTHPDLSASWRGGFNSWFDPNGEHAAPYDPSGHGTQTMGLMVGGSAEGSEIGVAPGARWIAVKIFNDAGYATLSGIHLGFQWLLDPDGDPATLDAPTVVNNSWGLRNSGGCEPEFDVDMGVLKTAGIGVVFAGGNDGPALLMNESPANNPAGFAVGAVDSTSTIASFSSRGPSACDGSFYPELTAPGVEVKTTDLSFGGLPIYAMVSGTSFAAPHVSGAFALLAQAFPGASIATLEETLKAQARDPGATGPDNDYGHGIVDVLAAYNALRATPPTNEPPAVENDSYSVQSGSTFVVDAPGVLGNDSDPEGFALTAVPIQSTTGGTLALNGDGSFSYTPAAGTTADEFTYQASDGALVSGSATVSITVVPNQPPVALDDTATTRKNIAVEIPVIANDGDPEGGIDPASITIAGIPAKGTAAPGANGTVLYTPNSKFTGTDSFRYTIRDLQGAVSDEATVTVTVTR